jgi:hypothetical protein
LVSLLELKAYFTVEITQMDLKLNKSKTFF